MSSKPQICDNPCETCAKPGLPILLTRYALMPNDVHAPRLSGPMDSADLKAVPLGSTAHYGLRLLRSGYVYVFDEKRNHWDEYFVTIDGFLSKLPPRIRALKAQHKPVTEFRCARNGSAPLAGLITVRNAKHAGNVWIAFSDVEWTDRIFAQHLDAAHRHRNMKCVSIGGGKVSPQKDTAPLEEVEQRVPEFMLDKTTAPPQFAKWGAHAYNTRQHTAPGLLQAVEQVRPGGGAAIVALHDPVGLAMEIASLMEVRKVTFMNQESVVKPRFAASSIATLESSLKEQAKLAEILAGEELARREEEGPGAWNPNPALWGTGGDLATAERWRTHTPQSLQKVADAKWNTYTHDRTGKPRFNAAASQAWLESYNQSLKQFDAEQIAPLARAHVGWMQHQCMVNHLTCNYDTMDLDSGAVYTSTVAHMIRHTADKQPSYGLYVQWLKQGETGAANNIVMRALGFNQDKLLEEIQKADTAPLDGRAFPSDMLVDFFKDGLEKLPSGGHAAMADLLQSVGGALFKNMGELAKGGPGARAIAAVAAVSGQQFTRIEAVGHRGKFVQHMMASIMQIDPDMRVSYNELGKAVAAEMKLLEVQGLPMNGTDKRQWLMVLDRSAVRAATGSQLTGDALAAQLAKAQRHDIELPRLKASAFRGGVASKAFDATGNVMIGLVQCYNFTKLVSDYTQGMSHEKNEAAAKLGFGAMAIVGSFGEATGLALQKVQEVKLRNAPGLAQSAWPEGLLRWGKRAGLVAGLAVAGVDLMKWRSEGAKGDAGLSHAYLASGIVGGGLAVAFYFASALGPIGWLFVGLAVIALLAITFWIEKNKDNKVHEWLMRSHFGTGAEKYKTHTEESEQLKLAFA
ncbi:T6SS effector BTH_I2691 family protein [Hydrogenophaga palleronii]|uniref:T6SS effector BTH_I2691 family protein n=1 Tax=Hydrogenophaga palleronii TaxID=65655 RepID=UPI000825933D|nr:T6SS effector BTH_I2691 family protein [Hydrogenophaga palleronii]